MAPRTNGWLMGGMVLAAILVLGSLAAVTWRALIAATPFFRAGGLVLAAAYVAWYSLAWYLRHRTSVDAPAPGSSAGRSRANRLRRVK